MVDECVESFVWGCVGGILAEFLKWYRIRETLHKEAPGYAKSMLLLDKLFASTPRID